MNADHYFTIGRPHQRQGTPCEDYARTAWLGPNRLMLAVADGCSGALADTDIGARALVCAFEQALSAQDKAVSGFARGFVSELERHFTANHITTRAKDYLATLVGMVATPTLATAFVFGDGALGVRYADGRHALLEVEWAHNTPCYLEYRRDPQQWAEFNAQAGDTPVTLRTTEFDYAGGEPHIRSVETRMLSMAEAADGIVLEFHPARDGIQALAVLTDGVTLAGPDTLSALHAFMAFKNFVGSFVKRRMTRAMADFEKAGHLPHDDLAIACVWFFGDEQP